LICHQLNEEFKSKGIKEEQNINNSDGNGSFNINSFTNPYLDAKIIRWNDKRDKKIADLPMTFLKRDEFPFKVRNVNHHLSCIYNVGTIQAEICQPMLLSLGRSKPYT
jgi:hypothetical protein